MIKKKFSSKSFIYAFEGLFTLLKTEPNSRIHLIAACTAILLGSILGITTTQWLFIALAISLVFSTELINSSIERIADLNDLNKNINIKNIKDLSSASVLITTLFSLVVGGVIFIPRILDLIK
jgi:diacylglycerol kinase